jgi:hypothetical protein
LKGIFQEKNQETQKLIMNHQIKLRDTGNQWEVFPKEKISSSSLSLSKYWNHSGFEMTEKKGKSETKECDAERRQDTNGV